MPSRNFTADWNLNPAAIVEGIRAGDPEAEAQLYEALHGPLAYLLHEIVGPQEFEDRLHNTFIIALKAIRSGELREPERLMGFLKTVVQRQAWEDIDWQKRTRDRFVALDPAADWRSSYASRAANPEQQALAEQQRAAMQRGLNTLQPFHQEIVTRVLTGQTPERIMREMKLTKRWYHLLKHRALSAAAIAAKRLLAGEAAPKHHGRPRRRREPESIEGKSPHNG